MDFLILGLILAALALVLGLCTRGGFRFYARGEWRLMRRRSWAPAEPGDPCTVHDPRVATLMVKQRALGKRMRRDGRSLLANKLYTPVLTKATPQPEQKPPKADRVVVPLRRR